jgi:hypothetical protein
VVVDATLSAADATQSRLAVTRLGSGVGVVPAALLRGDDVQEVFVKGVAT